MIQPLKGFYITAPTEIMRQISRQRFVLRHRIQSLERSWDGAATFRLRRARRNF